MYGRNCVYAAVQYVTLLSMRAASVYVLPLSRLAN